MLIEEGITGPYGVRGKPKTFTLPVSGSVLLYAPEAEIVATEEFQRLAGLKQLGTSYVVFRGAIHTRFEHSIGALHEAETIVKAINGNPYPHVEVDAKGHRLARLAALLHDLTHVPFGHTLEDEFLLLQRHDKNTFRSSVLLEQSQVGEILRHTIGAEEYELLLKILTAKDAKSFRALGKYAYVADIMGNTLCADLLDYVKRDLTACGMPVAMGDRFLDYLTITSDTEGGPDDHWRTAINIAKNRMPRPDVESEIVKLLSYRYELAERVYFHHAKNAASVMIGRAVYEAGFAVGDLESEEADSNFHWISDEMLLQALAKPKIHAALGLKRVGVHQNEALAARLASSVLSRNLYKIAYLAVDDDLAYSADAIFQNYSNPAKRHELENRLAVQAGLQAGQVLIHIPKPKMMTKEADIRVRTDRHEIVPLSQWDVRHSRRVTALNEAHQRLWRVTVYVDPGADNGHTAIVRSAAESEFGAPPRYVKRPGYTPLQSALYDQVAMKKGVVSVDKEQVLSGIKPFSTSQTREEMEAEIADRITLTQEEQAELANSGESETPD